MVSSNVIVIAFYKVLQKACRLLKHSLHSRLHVYESMHLHDSLHSFGSNAISSDISSEMERGGAKRKQARAHEAEGVGSRDFHGSSHLVRLLLHYWSWGFLSLPFLQKIAFAAAADLRAAGGADIEE